MGNAGAFSLSVAPATLDIDDLTPWVGLRQAPAPSSGGVRRHHQRPYNMNDLEARARRFSDERHARNGDTRKYTGDAYIAHPAAVAELVRTADHTPEMLAAAWLHDLPEHGCATFEEIEEEFGATVRGYVQMLTPVSRPQDGSRDVRKQMDRAYLAHAAPQAMTIKLADIIDNVSSVVARDPTFATVYLPEKLADLKVLGAGDARLYEMARVTIEQALADLQALHTVPFPSAASAAQALR